MGKNKYLHPIDEKFHNKATSAATNSLVIRLACGCYIVCRKLGAVLCPRHQEEDPLHTSREIVDFAESMAPDERIPFYEVK